LYCNPSQFNSMKSTIEAISDAGLKEKVKIMIGGGQIDEEVRQYTSINAYSVDAMAAVDLAKVWLGF
jgi:methanogenic corrinoid protein MtbC1